ncbi:MBL fold metallo-hydrolase, partial [Desulfovulcanus sp.]
MPQITVIVDNKTLSSALGCEHGLSMLIKLDNGRQWLWDTGQSELFIHNARALNLDLGQIHGLALSHGHYDHTGALDLLLASGFKGHIYAHP